LTSSFVIAGILLFAALFLSLQVRGQALENARRLLAGFSQLTAERTSQTLIAADLLLRSISDLAAEPTLADPDILRQRARTRQFQDSLGNLRALLPQIDVEAVLDDRGEVVASSGGSETGQTLGRSVADIFHALNRAPDIGLVVTAPAPSAVAGQWMLYMARALRDDSGRFAGVALVGIRTSYFEGYFSTIGVGEGGSVALISDDARMIARWPRWDEFIGARIGGAAPPALAPAGIPRVATVMGIDGKVRIVADTRLSTPDIPFHIAVTQPKALVLKPWLWMVGMTAGSTLVAVIVLAVLTLFLLRWLDQEERWAGAITLRESQLSLQAAELEVARHQAEGAQRARGRFIANMNCERRSTPSSVSRRYFAANYSGRWATPATRSSRRISTAAASISSASSIAFWTLRRSTPASSRSRMILSMCGTCWNLADGRSPKRRDPAALSLSFGRRPRARRCAATQFGSGRSFSIFYPTL
jgi:hypothetical protein